MKRSPYPLQWPPGRSRTKPADRRNSQFGGREPLTPYEAAKSLLAEVKRLGASHAVITSMLPTRHDGLPYSDGRTDDPGVAVWMVHRGHERVFACDRWRTPGENLRAIERSIEALRGLERWGMVKLIAEAHPDAGGDPARAAELNAALDDAERQLASEAALQGAR